MMLKKWFTQFAVAPCAFALALGLSACSDDSGTSVHIDTGDEITFNIPTGNGSSSSKVDTVTVIVNDPVSSDAGSSSSSAKETPASSATSSSSAESTKPASSATTLSSSSEDASSSASENVFLNDGWREDCLAKINEYRATENLAPLALASEEKQNCADDQSAADLASGVAHGHFGDCNEFAQNSGPNFSANFQKNASAVAEYYLKMMWEDEKAKVTSGERDPNNGDDYPYIGHYLNMKNTSYTKVACGIALSADGKKGWFNVNFY